MDDVYGFAVAGLALGFVLSLALVAATAATTRKLESAGSVSGIVGLCVALAASVALFRATHRPAWAVTPKEFVVGPKLAAIDPQGVFPVGYVFVAIELQEPRRGDQSRPGDSTRIRAACRVDHCILTSGDRILYDSRNVEGPAHDASVAAFSAQGCDFPAIDDIVVTLEAPGLKFSRPSQHPKGNIVEWIVAKDGGTGEALCTLRVESSADPDEHDVIIKPVEGGEPDFRMTFVDGPDYSKWWTVLAAWAGPAVTLQGWCAFYKRRARSRNARPRPAPDIPG